MAENLCEAQIIGMSLNSAEKQVKNYVLNSP